MFGQDFSSALGLSDCFGYQNTISFEEFVFICRFHSGDFRCLFSILYRHLFVIEMEIT